MVRQLVAAVLDIALAAVAGFAGFQLAYRSIPCQNVSECPALAPAVVLAVLVLVAAYFGIAYWLWRATLGQRIAHVPPDDHMT